MAKNRSDEIHKDFSFQDQSLKLASGLITKIKSPRNQKSLKLDVSELERDLIKEILCDYISQSKDIRLKSDFKNLKGKSISSFNPSDLSSKEYKVQSKSRDANLINSDSLQAKLQISGIMSSIVKQSAIIHEQHRQNLVLSQQGSFSSENEDKPDLIQYINSLKHREARKNLSLVPVAKVIDTCPKSGDLFSARSFVLLSTKRQQTQKPSLIQCDAVTQTDLTQVDIQQM